MPRFRNILSSGGEQAPAPPPYEYECITPPSSNSPFEDVGPGEKFLLSELEKLYWIGAKAELDNIITTLKAWRRSGVLREGQSTHALNVPSASEGHEDFIDSVSQRTRGFASKYDDLMKEARDFENHWLYILDWESYQKTTAGLLMHRKMRNASSKIRQDVKHRIEPVNANENEQLAWLLLQASGFLDIDKLIESRKQPEEKSARQPTTIQLTLDSVDERGMPTLKPQRCQQAGCGSIISSSMYVGNDAMVICEPCYRRYYNRQPGFSKVYKHSALNDVVTPVLARRICRCPGVARGRGENPTALYPCDPAEGHLNHGKNQCGLLKLGRVEARAKYEGLNAVAGENTPRKGGLSGSMAKLSTRDDASDKKSSSARKRVSAVFGSKSSDVKIKAPSAKGVVEDPAEDTNVPQFFRKFADKDAFSYVHMALRVGPLVIENGVGNTKNGALVTVRETPYYTTNSRRPGDSLVIDGGDRSVSKQGRSVTSDRKRYKAIMKQIVGSPFSTLPDSGEERDIIREVVEASSPPSYSSEKEGQEYDAVLESILGKLKFVLNTRLRTYLHSIVERLLDRETELTWSPTANTCQHFCNTILDQRLFKPLFGGSLSPGSKPPPYIISFVCPDEGYHQRIVRTKHDVAPGLTEDYLSNLYFGNHEQSDLIDANQEYWYDWAGLDKPECGHGEFFPFDCTRAYAGPKQDVSRDCGDCSLSRHLWAFPFDSWAMVSMHLARDPSDYPQLNHAWFQNRLTILHAQSVLCRAASAMTNSPALQAATSWMHSGSDTLASQPSLARIRMGGIHRAQPMGHYFDKGTNGLYFLASWAPLRSRAADYRAARKEKVSASDRPADSQDRFAKTAKGLLSSKDTAEAFGGFAGLNVPHTGGPPKQKSMFKTKPEQVHVAAGIWQMALIDEYGDRVKSACMDAAACGAGCGNSSCGGPACGTIPSSCTGPGFEVVASCVGWAVGGGM